MAAPRLSARLPHEQSDPTENTQFKRWWMNRSPFFQGKNSRQRRKERRAAERAAQAERVY